MLARAERDVPVRRAVDDDLLGFREHARVAGGGLDAAVESAMELGPTARALDGADDSLRSVVADGLRKYFAPLVRDGSVYLPAAIWIVSAGVE